MYYNNGNWLMIFRRIVKKKELDKLEKKLYCGNTLIYIKIVRNIWKMKVRSFQKKDSNSLLYVIILLLP